MKRCGCCEEIKEPTEFYANCCHRGGLGNYCKPCQNKANAVTRARNPKVAKAYDRRYWITRAFGVGAPAIYDQLLAEQNGVCAICEQECQSGMRLAMDHDHGTGRLRGLLCRDCNTSLGKFKDSIDVLQRAVAYLEKFNR